MSSRYEKLMDLLREVNEGFGREVASVLRQREWPPTGWIILRRIETSPGVTISELARRTRLAKSHVSNVVERLQQNGWVEKRNDPDDQRIVRLHLSVRGAEYLGEIRAEIRERIYRVVTKVPEEKLEHVIDGLQEIRGALKQRRENEGNE